MKKYLKLLGMLVFSSVLFLSCDSKQATEAEKVPVQEVANKGSVEDNVQAKLREKVASGEKDQGGPYGTFQFEKELHDFGPIKQGDVVEHTFLFENTGEVPLVISNIKASCGCTTPSWPKEPIEPGAEGKILVKFDSKGKVGQQLKNITIAANVPTGRKIITIKTNVEAAAANTSSMMGAFEKNRQVVQPVACNWPLFHTLGSCQMLSPILNSIISREKSISSTCQTNINIGLISLQSSL